MLQNKIQEFKIPVVNTINPFDSLEDLIAYTRELDDAEGFVVAFDDGHRIKIKAEQYVRLHKTVDKIQFDRHIVDIILNEEIDDVLSLLPPQKADRVRNFHERFSKQLHSLCESYDRYWNTVVASGLDRKRYAQEWMPTIKNNDPFAAVYVFGRFGNQNGREMIINHIRKHLTTNTRWNECAAWMDMCSTIDNSTVEM
jgi:RNA ligase